MGKARILGLALAATFAAGVVVVTSASAALPELKFEAGHAFPVTFTSKNKAGVEPSLHGSLLGVPITVSCKTSSDKGEIASFTENRKLWVEYTGCKNSETSACTSAGHATGVIVTESLAGKFGYIKKAAPVEVGLELKPESGTTFAEFECESPKVKTTVTGCVIGKATPLNILSATGELAFAASGTTQVPSKLEGGATCELSAFGGKASNVDTEVETFSQKVQLQA